MFWNRTKKEQNDNKKGETDEIVEAPPPPPPTFPLPCGSKIDHSPTIVNHTEYPIVVFLERGTLYNTRVIHPGEACCMTKQETGGGGLLPYRIHAVIGDESSLPKKSDSVKNLIKVSAIPAAFVAGCLATAMSAGTLAGPSAALAPLVSGMVVKGVVIDTAALAAGSVMASRAQIVTEVLLRKQKDKFMTVSNRLMPGQRYLIVTGGLSEGPLKIEEIERKKALKLQVSAVKAPKPLEDGNNLKVESETSTNEDSTQTNTIELTEESVIESTILSTEDTNELIESTVKVSNPKNIIKQDSTIQHTNIEKGQPSKQASSKNNDLFPVTVL